MNSQTRRWLVVPVLIGAIWLVIRGIDARPERRNAGEIRDSTNEANFMRLQREYGATPAWLDEVLDLGPPVWTLDLQRRWVGPGRPIIGTVELLDLAQDSAGYVAAFGSVYHFPPTFFWLRVTEGMIPTLLEDRDPYVADEYLIVATIEAVQRPPVTLELYVFYDRFEQARAGLEPGSHDYFLAMGVLHAAERTAPR